MIYRDKDWLKEQYIDLKRSGLDIAGECGVCKRTIYLWLEKHGIERRKCYEHELPELYLYNDKNWLWDQYIVEKRSVEFISEKCGVCVSSIYRALKKYNIPRSNEKLCYVNKLYRDEKWLREQYLTLRKTCNEMSEICDCNGVTIRNWLKIFGIPIRSISEAKIGKLFSENHKRNLSASTQGDKHWNWQNGKSFEPYCYLFNKDLKEEIRNRDNHVCQLCGKSEILNGQRLSVHHIDGDKMQGCNGKDWYLCALCNSCNLKADTVEKEFLIVSNMKR